MNAVLPTHPTDFFLQTIEFYSFKYYSYSYINHFKMGEWPKNKKWQKLIIIR